MKFLLLVPSWLSCIVGGYLLAMLAYADHPVAVNAYILLLIVGLLSQMFMMILSDLS